jgi:hypothetical protein
MDERGAPAPKVFISYRREDSAGHAGRLFDAIAARFGDDHVFMDVDLGPGVDFEHRITQTIGESDVLVVVIGPRWATVSRDGGQPRLFEERDYVRLEVETALARPEVKVIPVLVAGAQMPTSEQLPDSIQPLRRRNALELSDPRWRYDVGRLVNSLAEELGEPRPLPARSPEGSRRRTVWIAGGAALAVVILVGGLAAAGVFSGGGGGGGGGGSTTAGHPPPVDALVEAYDRAFETKDTKALRKILSPDVVLKRGTTSQVRGIDAVVAEYGRQFKSYGKGQPNFQFEVGGSDSSEERSETNGGYIVSVNGVRKEQGMVGFLALAVGSDASLKELCFDCPDLQPPGMLNA